MAKAARTGGEWVVAALRAEGVRHVFGIPGLHNLPIYDALLRDGAITHLLARHEAGAAFMADGYARACLLYTSPSPRDRQKYRMPSSA